MKVSFEKAFGKLLISIHERDKSREIAGGCSNKNYALRYANKYIMSHQDEYELNAVTVTTCDTDSLFNPQYFRVLERVYNCTNPNLGSSPKNCVWQSPLFYNWDLDKRPFFNRITGIMRSLMMLGGLISFKLNPMSVSGINFSSSV